MSLALRNDSPAGGNESLGGAGAGEGAGAWRAWAAVWAPLLLLTLALSAAGNAAVVLAIAGHRQLRTVTNAFVLSLALAELLGALLCLPPALLALLRGAWPFGERLCLAAATLHTALGVAATLTVALLSFERYRAIVRRPRRHGGRGHVAWLLATVWLAAPALSGPWYLLDRGQDWADTPAPSAPFRCMYTLPWASWRLGPPYGAAVIVLCYLLPFALMCFCHYNISRAVRLSESRVRPLAAYGRSTRFNGEMRTATTVLIMIVSVICCWAPYCVLGLAAATGRLSLSPAVDMAASWMAWVNGAINPLIYAARNPNISLLLRRNRELGYRTRNNVAIYLAATQSHRLEAKSHAERYASHGCGSGSTAGSTQSSSTPASGGEVAMWACKNPAILFCRDGQPDTLSKVDTQPKSDTVDTSL